MSGTGRLTKCQLLIGGGKRRGSGSGERAHLFPSPWTKIVFIFTICPVLRDLQNLKLSRRKGEHLRLHSVGSQWPLSCRETVGRHQSPARGRGPHADGVVVQDGLVYCRWPLAQKMSSKPIEIIITIIDYYINQSINRNNMKVNQ